MTKLEKIAKKEYLCNNCLEELELATLYEGNNSRLSFDCWGEEYLSLDLDYSKINNGEEYGKKSF